jgi:hypothetical protein
MVAEDLGILELATEFLMLISKFLELGPEVVGQVLGHSFRGLSIGEAVERRGSKTTRPAAAVMRHGPR